MSRGSLSTDVCGREWEGGDQGRWEGRREGGRNRSEERKQPLSSRSDPASDRTGAPRPSSPPYDSPTSFSRTGMQIHSYESIH